MRLISFYDDVLKDPVISYKKTRQNAINQKIITLYDALDREILIEHINPLNQRVSLEEKFYDLNGNLTRQVSTIYNPDKSTRQIVACFWYDNMNRAVSLIEAYGTKDEKITNYSYTPTGTLKVTIKPDGTQLINEYDPLGNKTGLYSSDRNIFYEFVYNNLNQVIEAKDAIENRRTVRKYDASGNLLEETLSNGLKIKNDYNLLDDKIKCVFPDNSFVEYIYDPLNLKQVIRKDKYGYELYKHEFLEYDLSGNLLKEKLIQNSGIIDYEIDHAFQITKISHEIIDKQNNKKENAQYIVYDEIGRIPNIKHQGFLDYFCEYKYDDLNQIIQETGLFSNSYEFDSNYNRLKKNNDNYQINNLNEIISASNEKISYDQNGNLLQRITKNGEINYFYDALDRLIKIEKAKDCIIEFSYDPFNRRISKRVLKYSYIWGWFDEDFKYFLYDYQNEIGSFDQDLNQKELRILSDTEDAEIGSAIAFEIDSQIYAPVYDFQGNVSFLFLDRTLQEHYRYSAFGERKIFSSWGYKKNNSQINNPWQYCSKRIDEESGLIFFGRRYYDSNLGRWLTPDPKGFEDGMNLYVYVHNDPLINLDLYGLYTTPQWLKNSAEGTLYGAANFGVQNINFLTNVGFAAASPFLYGYRKLTGGSFADDYQMHLNQKANLKSDVQDFMQRIFPVNQESKSFVNSRNAIDSILNGAILGSSIGGLYKAGNILAFRTLDLYNKSSQFLKRLNSYPSVNSTTGLSLNNKAYSGIDIEKTIKEVKKNIQNIRLKNNPFQSNPFSISKTKTWSGKMKQKRYYGHNGY